MGFLKRNSTNLFTLKFLISLMMNLTLNLASERLDLIGSNSGNRIGADGIKRGAEKTAANFSIL